MSGRLTRWFIPLSLLGVLVLLAGTTWALARGSRDKEPPRPGAFAIPTPVRPIIALDVQQAREGRLTLGTGTGNVEATFSTRTPIWVLRPAAVTDIKAGDWLTVIGIPNEVLNFAIRQVVLIPADLSPQPDEFGIPRLTGGLAGNEAGRDPREQPVVSGRVERVAGRAVTLASTRAGTFTLDIAPGSPFQRIASAGPADIREGDRLAYLPPKPGARAEEAAAVLVLPAVR